MKRNEALNLDNTMTSDSDAGSGAAADGSPAGSGTDDGSATSGSAAGSGTAGSVLGNSIQWEKMIPLNEATLVIELFSNMGQFRSQVCRSDSISSNLIFGTQRGRSNKDGNLL